jgi:hypothetical protein
MSHRLKKCPKCGSDSIAEILYGLPAFDEQMERDIDSGKIVLGGCCISDDSSKGHCNKCKYEWGSVRGNSR